MMKKMNDIPEGYKQTKVGVIPEDWEVNTVGNALIIENNKRRPINEEERKFIQGQYPYYGPTKIQDYINDYQYKGLYALIAEDGDHFLKYKDQSMTQMASGKFNVNNHAHVLKGTDECLIKWFYWFYNRRSIYSHITRQGAGRYKLNKAALEQLPIPLPPLPEQQKIAEILSTWDTAISTTQKLIAQLQLRNKGLAQQLLTGKKRLRGFEGEWEKISFGQFLNESRIKGNSGLNAKKITVKLYGKGVWPKDDNKAGSENTQYYLRKAGQFIYSKLDFLNGAFGIIPNELDNYESTLDLPCFDIKDEAVIHQFLLSFVKREEFYQKYSGGAVGGRKARRIQVTEFLAIKAHFPLIDEQRAIASVLKQADKELNLYQQQLSTLQAQKKGLMQKLLTGEVRVKYE